MSDDSRFGAGGDRLDRAIDRAVRTMMRVDPPLGLRRRVIARLEGPVRRAWWGSGIARLAFASAALLGVIVALTVLGRRAPAEPPESAAPRTATARPQPPTLPLPVRREDVRPVPASQPPDTSRQAASTHVAAAHVFGPAVGRVTSATIAPLTPDSRGATPPSADSPPGEDDGETRGLPLLRIAPLEVRPLRIAPLAAPR